MEYSVREFRMKLKEALDRSSGGECVHIRRGEEVYEISKCVHAVSKGRECVHKTLEGKEGMTSVFKSIAK